MLPQLPLIQNNTQSLCRILIGLNLSPNQFQIVQTIQYTKTLNNPENYRPQLEDIPELEDDEENWEEGQFVDTDFINHHNTTEESDQICREYSSHFEKVTDQGYSSQNNRTPGLEYYIPEPEYYNSDT